VISTPAIEAVKPTFSRSFWNTHLAPLASIK